MLCLTGVEGEIKDQAIVIGTQGAVIGRGRGCELVLKQGCVSRKHCEVSLREGDGQFVIRDLASTTGTFVQLDNDKALRNNFIF